MRSLTRFILAGPIQAITVVFGFALLSLPFPVLIIFSGGALALVTLQMGFRQGAMILLISVTLITVATFFILGSITSGPLLAWLSVVIFAYVYRNFQSLSLTLQLLTIFGVVITAFIAIMLPDMQTKWLNYLQNFFAAIEKEPSFQAMLENAKLDADKVHQYLPIAASIMTGGLVSLYLLTMSMTLFLGRWWQGLPNNIQIFRKEFIALKLGRVLAALALLFVLTALVVKHAILWQLAIVCLGMFSLQGIAIAHAVIGQISNSTLWFVMIYGLLFIAAPQMLVALSTFGVMDAFIDFRLRFAKSQT